MRASTSARRAGSSQTGPTGRPVRAASGLVAELKMTLSHCGPRASTMAWHGSPARVSRSESATTSPIVAGFGSNGPSQVSPGASKRTTPGSTIAPAGRIVPRMTRGTGSAMTSSLPSPFCTLATAASAKTSAPAATAARVCSALVATMPKSQGGTSVGSVVAWTGAVNPKVVSRLVAALLCTSTHR